MAFPADVKLVRVTCGTGYDFSGDPIAITLEVTPVLGGSLKRLIHAATGTFMTRDALTFKSDPGSPATFTVPSPAQAETWKDGSGAFFTNWSYSVTVTTRTTSGKVQSWIQSFQPVDGQETVDLDLVPDGQIGSPTSAPAPAVTSVNGQSGAVVIDGGESVTPESVAANLTVEAVDAKLPERLSESALSAATVQRKTTAAQETPTVGANIATSAGWTLGAGWAGDFASGFTHTPGSTAPLTWTPPTGTGTATWLVEWVYSGPEGVHQDVFSGYDVHLGDGYAGITYQGAGASNINFSRAIKSQADGNLTFTPWSEFDGTIGSITVRPMISAAAVGIGWTDADGFRTAELRFSKSIYDNVFLGKDAGKWHYSGISNVGIGSYSMANNVTGFFNTAVGRNTLNQNINGTRNVALGYNALQLNTAGDRNVAIGPFALTRNTTGQRNVAIGTDNLWRNTTGSDNVGIGYLTLTEMETGTENIAIGKYAMRQPKAGAQNVAIGSESLHYSTGFGNVAIGTSALRESVQSYGTAIGHLALSKSNATQQVAIGAYAQQFFTGGRNTAIGSSAMKGVEGASTGTRNVAIGDNAASGLTTGSNNTVIGPSAGAGLTTGTGNILIGFAAAPSGNIDNFLNIGNVLYGNTVTQRFGIARALPTARFHLPAGKATAGDAPMKIATGTLLDTPEDGALEFSAGKLYFTPSGGIRREIAFVTV